MKPQSIVKILLVTILSIQMNIVKSQELTLNYKNEDGSPSDTNAVIAIDNTSILRIDPDSGNIEITTTDNASDIVGQLGQTISGDSPNVNLVSIPNGNVSARINWILENDPVYCQKFGAWTGIIVGTPLVENDSQVVFSDGNYTLRCYNAVGSKQDTVIVNNIPVLEAPTLTFTASPLMINSGDPVTLSWNIGNSPTQCTSSGDWPTPGNLPASDISNGPHSLVIPNVTLNRTYSLECFNSEGTSGKITVAVNIIGGTTWPSCGGAAASILNGNEDRSILAIGSGIAPKLYNGLYSDIFNNSGSDIPRPWPGNLGSSIRLNIEKNHYVAAQFTTTNDPFSGTFLTQVPSNNEGVPAQAYTVSISACPGDFNVHLGDPNCKFNFASFKWSTEENPPGSNFCKLDRNTTYYLNIVHSNNASNNNYATTNCLSQQEGCGHLALQNENN